MLIQPSFLLLFRVLVAVTLVAFAPAVTASVRIMPLGDSITQGDDRHNSYRRPLWQKLRQASFDVDFVGTFNTQFGGGRPPMPDFDLDHQGEWGREAFAVLPKVQGYAEAVKPDIVLLHLGTNDIRSTRSTVAETLVTLSEIIDVLRRVNPSVTILLASIIPAGDLHAANLQALAAEIPALAIRKTTAASKVVLVDQNTGFDGKLDTYDGVHPNEGGEEKMAQKWFAALQPILSGGGVPAPPVLSRVLSAASLSAGPVSPGEIITLTGSGIGPATPAVFRVNSAGLLDISMAQTRVQFDSAFAPLIYVSANQINAIVPYAVVPNSTTRVQVEFQGIKSNVLTLPVAAAAPALFTANSSGTGSGAILNQDGTLNSPANPAEKGLIAVLYLTGEGQTIPRGMDGKIAGEVLPVPVLPLTVAIDGIDSATLYAGAAPASVPGLVQVNTRIPVNAASGNAVPVVVRIGGIASPAGITIAIR